MSEQNKYARVLIDGAEIYHKSVTEAMSHFPAEIQGSPKQLASRSYADFVAGMLYVVNALEATFGAADGEDQTVMLLSAMLGDRDFFVEALLAAAKKTTGDGVDHVDFGTDRENPNEN